MKLEDKIYPPTRKFLTAGVKELRGRTPANLFIKNITKL